MLWLWKLSLKVKPVRATAPEHSEYPHPRSSKTIRSTCPSLTQQLCEAGRAIAPCLANGARQAGMRKVYEDEQHLVGSNSLLVGPLRDCRMRHRAGRVAGLM